MSLRAPSNLYWRLERLLAPGAHDRKWSYEEALRQHVPQGARWLDIGCGHTLLPPWSRQQEQELLAKVRLLIGIDYDLDSLKQHETISHRVRGDITHLPFASGCFDLVTANMVVEHLREPARQFREVSRVLRPGGVYILHTPNRRSHIIVLARMMPEGLKKKLIRLLDGRAETDIFPTYYHANTRTRLTQLAIECGFKTPEIRMVVGGAVSAVLLPVAVLELLWIRLLMTKPGTSIRTNIIAILRKEAS
jgi:ubiquinone/menaquinone biosynthesis C-methylase UbiE